jgi:hypothetical protein
MQMTQLKDWKKKYQKETKMSEFVVIQGDAIRKTHVDEVVLVPAEHYGVLSTFNSVKVNSRVFRYPSFEEALADRDRIVKELTGETNE